MCSNMGNNEVLTNVSCEEKQILRRMQLFYKEFMIWKLLQILSIYLEGYA